MFYPLRGSMGPSSLGVAAYAITLAIELCCGDALSRLRADRLQAVRDAVEELKHKRRAPQSSTGFDDIRALLHVHSQLSHDSRGTIDQIVGAARAVGARVVMFTEHPSEHYDYFSDGYHGMKDGVLLVPGAETRGFLAFPTRSLSGENPKSHQEFADLVRRDNGLVFLSHLEERLDWDIAGLTGVEIYNTHADVKDEKNFLAALRNPLLLFGILPVMRQYPQESFAALQDYPAEYLRRWDELGRMSRLTGIAANDAHQNQAVLFRLTDDGKAQMEDALGKKSIELSANQFDFLKPLVVGKQRGDIIFEQYLDRYEYSFGYVSTHLLMRELSREQAWEALNAGRAYVAFDWIADPTGFIFEGRTPRNRLVMGSETNDRSLRLHVETPLEGNIRVIRDGLLHGEASGYTMDMSVDQPGVYRVEVWVTIAGEGRPWILSNPIYVRDNK